MSVFEFRKLLESATPMWLVVSAGIVLVLLAYITGGSNQKRGGR